MTDKPALNSTDYTECRNYINCGEFLTDSDSDYCQTCTEEHPIDYPSDREIIAALVSELMAEAVRVTGEGNYLVWVGYHGHVDVVDVRAVEAPYKEECQWIDGEWVHYEETQNTVVIERGDISLKRGEPEKQLREMIQSVAALGEVSQ